MSHAERLLLRALSPANEKLVLPGLDPEVRRIIGEVGENRHQRRPAVEALVQRAIEIRNQRDHKIRPLLRPEIPEQPNLTAMIDPNDHMHRGHQLRGAQSPALLQKQVVHILQAEPSDLAENIQRVEHLLQIHQPHIPGTLLLLYDGLQGIGGSTMAATRVEVNEIYLAANAAIFARVVWSL